MLHAVLIGVNAPRDPTILPLKYARADAEEIAEVLFERENVGPQITVLVDEGATKGAIARVITDDLPRRLSPEDTVLLYFAGYGSPELEALGPEPSIHLVAYDTEQARLHATSINVVTELATWARRLPVRTVGMVFDTSFNGMAGGRTFEGPGLRSGPRTRTLHRISPARATMDARYGLLTACSETEVAREATAYQHGVFTHHLLNALRGRELQSHPTSLSTLHRAVCKELENTSEDGQHPTLHGGGLRSPLLFLGTQGPNTRQRHASAARQALP
jgi:uncharacterized caspase-like protein